MGTTPCPIEMHGIQHFFANKSIFLRVKASNFRGGHYINAVDSDLRRRYHPDRFGHRTHRAKEGRELWGQTHRVHWRNLLR